jgi:hypothetical protein
MYNSLAHAETSDQRQQRRRPPGPTAVQTQLRTQQFRSTRQTGDFLYLYPAAQSSCRILVLNSIEIALHLCHPALCLPFFTRDHIILTVDTQQSLARPGASSSWGVQQPHQRAGGEVRVRGAGKLRQQRWGGGRGWGPGRAPIHAATAESRAGQVQGGVATCHPRRQL